MANAPATVEPHRESRWPPAIALALTAALLLGVLPKHVVVLPMWVSHVSAIAVFASLAAAAMLDSPRWRRVERALIVVLGLVYAINTVAQLADLVGVIAIRPQGTSAAVLLSSAVGIWIENIVVFSLVYWQIDGGGPDERAGGVAKAPDWGFPAPPGVDGAPAKAPAYVDYFCLAYTTATAFSPTDVSPYTHRAKLLMTAQSAISLVTLVVVLSRAINVLPS
jgi:hypothetical protein